MVNKVGLVAAGVVTAVGSGMLAARIVDGQHPWIPHSSVGDNMPLPPGIVIPWMLPAAAAGIGSALLLQSGHGRAGIVAGFAALGLASAGFVVGAHAMRADAEVDSKKLDTADPFDVRDHAVPIDGPTGMKAQFLKLYDHDGDGSLTARKQSRYLSPASDERVTAWYDADSRYAPEHGDNNIGYGTPIRSHYGIFLAADIDKSGTLTPKELNAAVHHADRDHDNLLSPNEQMLFAMYGNEYRSYDWFNDGIALTSPAWENV